MPKPSTVEEARRIAGLSFCHLARGQAQTGGTWLKFQAVTVKRPASYTVYHSLLPGDVVAIAPIFFVEDSARIWNEGNL